MFKEKTIFRVSGCKEKFLDLKSACDVAKNLNKNTIQLEIKKPAKIWQITIKEVAIVIGESCENILYCKICGEKVRFRNRRKHLRSKHTNNGKGRWPKSTIDNIFKE